MDKLNDYLRSLLSTCSEELRLEPNKNPYLISNSRNSELANVPLLGTQISTMVFPLIPQNVKIQLPGKDEVEFLLSHQLGNFNFRVQKSPSGFNVTVRPVLGAPSASLPDSAPAEPPVKVGHAPVEQAPFIAAEAFASGAEAAPEYDSVSTHVVDTFSNSTSAYQVESAAAASEISSSIDAPTDALKELLLDNEATAAAEYLSGADLGPEVEVVSVNDPEYQTVFSETAPDLPGTRQDSYYSDEYLPPSGSPLSTLSYDVSAPVITPDPSALEQPMVNYPPQPPFTSPSVPAPAAEPVFVPAAENSQMRARMESLFCRMADIGASDLHLSVSMPPMARRDGKMQQLHPGEPIITPTAMRDLLNSIMPERNQEEFGKRSDTDFAYEIPGLARFRCNIFEDRKGMGAVFRIIPSKILTAEELGLSKAIMDLCGLSKGLVVVTGPTGSGKSTTLCAMVDAINKQREDHIITIEDPIEFVHENQKCLVNQREVHNHTDSFKDALRAALREDPDIVLVGEMRDLETISIAIETAETGHLVFGTLHTTTAASTVDRIIDQFPADRQQQIRVMLSESLKGVIAQTLLPKKGGGRVAALEVLIVTPAISNLIREGKTFQIPSAMQTGKNHGMVMLNDALFEHVQAGRVEARDAYIKAVDKAGFEAQLTRGGFKI